MKNLIFFAVFLVVLLGTVFLYFIFESYFEEPAEKPNVLLITIDCLGADYFNQRLTPAAMDLARKGVVCSEAITSSPAVLPSYGTLMTGLYPPRHGAREDSLFSLSADAKTLAFVLKSADYRTGAFVGSSLLDKRFGLGRYFDVYEEAGERSESVYPIKRRAEDVARDALKWIIGGEKFIPFFVWLNFSDPLYPFYSEESSPPATYETEIAYADRTLAQALAILGYEKLLDKTLIIIVGSHAESADGDNRAEKISDSAIRVPLVMFWEKKLPAGLRIDRQVRIADVFPTVAEILKIKTPPGLDGFSFLPLIEGEKEKDDRECYLEFLRGYYSFGLSPVRGLRTQSLKLVSGAETTLFDLQGDPVETEDISSSFPDKMERIKSAFDGATEKFPPSAIFSSADEEISSAEYKELANKADEAKRLILSGRTDLAIRNLKKTLEKHPRSFAFRMLLARAYLQAGDWKNSIDETRRAEDIAEEFGVADANIHLIRAECFIRTKERERAVAEADSALRISPQYSDALRFAGDIYLSADETGKAREFYDKAVALNKRNFRAMYSLGCLYLTEKNYDEAEKRYRKIFEELGGKREDPFLLADAIVGLGVVRIARGEMEGIAEYFEGALQIVPDHPVALYHLGMTAFADGDWQKANDVLKRYLEIDTSVDSEQRHQALAKLQMMKGFVR